MVNPVQCSDVMEKTLTGLQGVRRHHQAVSDVSRDNLHWKHVSSVLTEQHRLYKNKIFRFSDFFICRLIFWVSHKLYGCWFWCRCWSYSVLQIRLNSKDKLVIYVYNSLTSASTYVPAYFFIMIISSVSSMYDRCTWLHWYVSFVRR